jgi:hypothetical protein
MAAGRLAPLIILGAWCAAAQTGPVTPTNPLGVVAVAAGKTPPGGTNAVAHSALQFAAAQAASIQNRRQVCGRIMKILPEGVVVDSGYTNLLTYAKWLIPQTVAATRADNLIEENQPGAVCVGLVFVTDLPKTPGARPKVYDYVNVQGYPAGQFSYTSVGDLRRTVRKFSVQIEKAVQWRLTEGEGTNAPGRSPPPKPGN